MPALALLGGVSARALGFASGLGAGGSGAAALFNFTTHTFTPGGNVGRFGPTITNLRNAYTSQTWAQDAQYFFEGRAQGYQVFRVPVDGIYEIEVAGARGQSSSTGLGNGLGAIVRGRFTLSQNALLEMVVGQRAGDAGSDNPSNSFAGGSGGSFVGIYNTSNPLIVAGGGGGTYSTLAMGSLSFSNGSTRRRGHVYTGYSPADYNSNMPAAGQGGYGYHGGGGGGFLSAGQPYPGNSGSAVMTTAGGGQQTTHGASFIGGSVDNAAGTWYATGGNATIVSSSGGFGGGGGGHSGNNTAGGGGGYTGGMGGQTSLGGSYGSGLGGGSYIDPAATNVATSDGQYDGSGTFNSQAITNLGSFRNGDGYITITLISSFAGGGGGSPTPAPAGVIDINLTTITGVGFFDLPTTFPTQMLGMTFKPDGTRMYASDFSGSNLIYQYNISTPWNLSTLSFSATFNPGRGGISDIAFNGTGTHLYVIDRSTENCIAQYSCSTPWDITTASFIANSNLTLENIDCLFVSADGLNFIVGSQTTNFQRWSSSSPNVITSLSRTVGFSHGLSVLGMGMDPAGTFIYYPEFNSSGNFYKRQLSTPWDVSTAGPATSRGLPTTGGTFGNLDQVYIADAPKRIFIADYQSGGRRVHVFSYT